LAVVTVIMLTLTNIVATTLIATSSAMSHADIKDYLVEQSIQQGVSPELVLYMAENESHFRLQAIGDMDITCPHTGKPVRSRGIFQISECWYPEITDQEAFSLASSTAFALSHIKKSKQWCMSQWTTCRAYFKSYPHRQVSFFRE